jgi:hypothetical protein
MNRQGSGRVVGLALLASALVLLLVAILIWVGAFGVPQESRAIIGGALLLAAVVDLFVGLRFFQQAS